MPQHRFNKVEAAKAGATKGKHKKTLEWEQLGEAITEKHSARFNTILDSLNDKDFIQAYTSIIGYFKPKMQSTQLDANINKPHVIEYKNVSKHPKYKE